jgi:murein DD-endopeptidase MepM/ murein hydrolase activator NlpD
MNTVAEQAFGYLTSKGMPAHVAAGLIGNMAIESAYFDPDVISGKRAGDHGKSRYGFQWNGSRLQNYEAYARERNRDPRDVRTQFDFALEEMNPQSKYADVQASRNRAAILGAPTYEAVTQAFAQHYERPSTPHLGRREAAAKQAYEGYFSAKTANAPTPTSRDIGLAMAPTITETQATAQAPQTVAQAPQTVAMAPQTAVEALDTLAPTQAGYISPLGMFGDRITSDFGGRKSPGGRGSTNHKGIDLTAAAINPATQHNKERTGYPAVAIAPGFVTHAGPMKGMGLAVEVTHDDGKKSRYGHLEGVNPSLSVGSRVGQGVPVGRVGNTGVSTGAHLHFEMIDENKQKMNPASVIAFAEKRDVPTPTSAPRTFTEVAEYATGVPAKSVPTTSVAPNAPMASLPGFHDAQMASLTGFQAPTKSAATPSARAAETASMAALNNAMQDQFSARIDQAHAPQAINDRIDTARAVTSQPMSARETEIATELGNYGISPAVAASFNKNYAEMTQPVAPQTAAAVAPAPAAPVNAPAPTARAAQDYSMAALNTQPPVAQEAPWGAIINEDVPAVQATPVQTLAAPVVAPQVVAPTVAAYAPAVAVNETIAPTAPRSAPTFDANGWSIAKDAETGKSYAYSPISDMTTVTQFGEVTGRYAGHVTPDTAPQAEAARGGLFDGGLFSGGIFSGDTGGLKSGIIGGLGQLGGTVIGSAVLGPVGGVIGSAIGRNLANNMFSQPQMTMAPISPREMAALRDAYQGGLGFPDAPSRTGQEWGGWSDGTGFGSRGYAEGVSPGATAAIDAGRGGLY